MKRRRGGEEERRRGGEDNVYYDYQTPFVLVIINNLGRSVTVIELQHWGDLSP